MPASTIRSSTSTIVLLSYGHHPPTLGAWLNNWNRSSLVVRKTRYIWRALGDVCHSQQIQYIWVTVITADIWVYFINHFNFLFSKEAPGLEHPAVSKTSFWVKYLEINFTNTVQSVDLLARRNQGPWLAVPLVPFCTQSQKLQQKWVERGTTSDTERGEVAHTGKESVAQDVKCIELCLQVKWPNRNN